MLRFHFITIFPDMIAAYAGEALIARAAKNKLIEVSAYNPRDFLKGKAKHAYRAVDDRPYGGGPGMVFMADPVVRATEQALKGAVKSKRRTKVIMLSPQGKQFDNAYATKISKRYDDVVFIAGRYEGVDARVKKIFKAEEVSGGPYVVTGGELPALMMMDAITRQIPGVLGKIESLEESRAASPEVYTRPEVYEYKGKKYRVPKVLLGGDHKKIEAWRVSKIKKGGEGT
ncbi:MAG: tRNA (guanosine(37)-N1)-methyltransferase TrmD [Candidatus Yonathbacteria bacterium RIFCSPHIGHO2_01_FULL_51_10]|uniref:tRNA (guanine-N(1)-)-methyltransferase n=1 Tax=Candidatus Yonathbacteria bacterium RIFCSPHIGHO2_01_FULL_51_10 TaxID=1802723 RepID=A0A1G2S9C7_9BACT|nr:MAG: tRNA (guanosine(37)-N1)-methyltransferase TrmD [Candidatus Yonathbacteria bacterium RIFCSPHIGHO2_01_FULL_51_10]